MRVILPYGEQLIFPRIRPDLGGGYHSLQDSGFALADNAALKIDSGIAKAEPQPTEESTSQEPAMTTFQARKRWSRKAG